MKELIYFVATFFITFSLSYFTVIRKVTKKEKKKKKKRNKKIKFKKRKNKKLKNNNLDKDDDKLPVEVMYLVNKYHLDLEKINYKKLLYTVSIVASIDMAIVMVVISPIKNIYLQILVGFFVIIPLILVTYNSIANYYIKRGMIKNEHERNRK